MKKACAYRSTDEQDEAGNVTKHEERSLRIPERYH